jgi:hypothetical protein
MHNVSKLDDPIGTSADTKLHDNGKEEVSAKAAGG